MDDMSLISLATGPFSSLVLLTGMGLGAWRFSSTVVIPNVIRWIDEQQAHTPSLGNGMMATLYRRIPTC